jgi:hypothetical protein
MNTLNYTVTTPLNIPAEIFSPKGLAVLLLRGASYGGAWVVNAVGVALDGTVGDMIIGSIETDEAERQPDRALDAMRAWLEDYCAGTPFSLAHFESLNNHYGPGGAPFFSSARVAIAIPMN